MFFSVFCGFNIFILKIKKNLKKYFLKNMQYNCIKYTPSKV
jgi:hypothetical protein